VHYILYISNSNNYRAASVDYWVTNAQHTVAVDVQLSFSNQYHTIRIAKPVALYASLRFKDSKPDLLIDKIVSFLKRNVMIMPLPVSIKEE